MPTQLTASQLATLKAKVTGTPALLALWAAGTPVPIAEALSDPTDATYAGTVTLSYLDRGPFLTALRPALASLPSATAAIQAKWDRVLSWVMSVDWVVADSGTIDLINSAVTDGVLTQAQADACYKRTGSWAEVNFGAGTTLNWWDITAAMGT